MNRNRKAFLDMIAWSEGTAGKGDDGYNVLVGGKLFESYEDHPRKLVDLGRGLKSTAAGRYQMLARYYDYYSKKLGLEGFSPAVQDALAMDGFIGDCRAQADIDAGRIESAVRKCARIWASFPGAGYGQHENKMTKLLDAYTKAGGSFGKVDETEKGG